MRPSDTGKLPCVVRVEKIEADNRNNVKGKCVVHLFKNYTKLENVGAEDYYCKFEYKAFIGGFTPDQVAVFCKCEMPYNPDDARTGKI
ncbi:hypothetical protein QQ045_009777 [Rhodiola kirilowii]